MTKEMHAALIVNPVTSNWRSNLANAIQMIQEANDKGANLVLLGEMAITGMVNNDIPRHDLPLAETVPGPITICLSKTASRLGIWLAFGLLEREEDCLYDSALLFTSTGDLAQKYRRIHPGWHGPEADAAIYLQGNEVKKTETDFGSVTFFICGDLFDEAIRSRVHELQPDWIFHPHARSFIDGSRDQEKWEKEERPNYERLVRTIGAPILATSYLCTENFSEEADTYGGAMVFGRNGALLASQPLGQSGILYFNPVR
jgi:predicted amidohydrolase